MAQAPFQERDPDILDGVKSYTVKKGDNLTRYASRNNTTIEEIMKLNPHIKNRDKIYIGDKIILPGKWNDDGSEFVDTEDEIETDIVNANEISDNQGDQTGGVDEIREGIITDLNNRQEIPVSDTQANFNALKADKKLIRRQGLKNTLEFFDPTNTHDERMQNIATRHATKMARIQNRWARRAARKQMRQERKDLKGNSIIKDLRSMNPRRLNRLDAQNERKREKFGENAFEGNWADLSWAEKQKIRKDQRQVNRLYRGEKVQNFKDGFNQRLTNTLWRTKNFLDPRVDSWGEPKNRERIGGEGGGDVFGGTSGDGFAQLAQTRENKRNLRRSNRDAKMREKYNIDGVDWEGNWSDSSRAEKRQIKSDYKIFNQMDQDIARYNEEDKQKALLLQQENDLNNILQSPSMKQGLKRGGMLNYGYGGKMMNYNYGGPLKYASYGTNELPDAWKPSSQIAYNQGVQEVMDASNQSAMNTSQVVNQKLMEVEDANTSPGVASEIAQNVTSIAEQYPDFASKLSTPFSNLKNYGTFRSPDNPFFQQSKMPRWLAKDIAQNTTGNAGANIASNMGTENLIMGSEGMADPLLSELAAEGRHVLPEVVLNEGANVAADAGASVAGDVATEGAKAGFNPTVPWSLVGNLAGKGITALADDQDPTTLNVGETAGTVVSGASTGAGIGSVLLPGIGTVLGGLVGGLWSGLRGKKKRDEARDAYQEVYDEYVQPMMANQGALNKMSKTYWGTDTGRRLVRKGGTLNRKLYA